MLHPWMVLKPEKWTAVIAQHFIQSAHLRYSGETQRIRFCQRVRAGEYARTFHALVIAVGPWRAQSLKAIWKSTVGSACREVRGRGPLCSACGKAVRGVRGPRLSVGPLEDRHV